MFGVPRDPEEGLAMEALSPGHLHCEHRAQKCCRFLEDRAYEKAAMQHPHMNGRGQTSAPFISVSFDRLMNTLTFCSRVRNPRCSISRLPLHFSVIMYGLAVSVSITSSLGTGIVVAAAIQCIKAHSLTSLLRSHSICFSSLFPWGRVTLTMR